MVELEVMAVAVAQVVANTRETIMIIKVTTNELRDRANTLKKYVSDDEKIINKLTNLILNIDNIWQGEAQTEFLNKYQISKKELEELRNAILIYSKFINEVANEMEKLDDDLSREIKNIG